MKKLVQFNALLEQIHNHPDADFYRKKWGVLYAHPFDSFEDLKYLSIIMAEDFLENPIEKRLYTKGKSLTKIILYGPRRFLIKRELNELRREQYGFLGERPAVLFKDNHEAIEKSFWCYERNALPLIAENANDSAALFSIERYNTDSLFCDFSMLKELFDKKPDADFSSIRHYNIIGDYFDSKLILKYIEPKKLNLILALSETGAFAFSCPDGLLSGKMIFHPDRNSVLEINGRLIITKLLFMPTPVIRYMVDIFVESQEYDCNCEEKVSFAIL
ncbi:hypothetical protein IIA95_03525 [Patescibacteria group bacterium]|nr:hypothetical protein [Patescibacteria group bacterium]